MTEDESLFQPGERITHPEFGQGVVLDLARDGYLRAFFPLGERRVPVSAVRHQLSRTERILRTVAGGTDRGGAAATQVGVHHSVAAQLHVGIRSHFAADGAVVAACTVHGAAPVRRLAGRWWPSGRGTLDGAGPLELHANWGHVGPDQRELHITTRCGHEVALLDSGGTLVIDGRVTVQEARTEYPMLYARFAELVLSGQSEADLTPLQMTLDALALGKRVALPRFEG